MEPPSSTSHVHERNVAGPESLAAAGFFPSCAFEETPEILIEDRRWHCHVPRPEHLIRRALAACEGYGRQPGSVVLSTDRVVRVLNGQHRGKHRPTNVLTFDPPPGIPGGDIILALETVLREARQSGKSVSHHLAHLIVHGSLHLAGYDHHQAGEAREMEMLEARLLSRLHIPNPWKPRA
ncbi:MAG: rRNA maturation RNase YbeY [Acetobacter malorum]